MTMITFLLIFNFLQVEACLRTSEKKLPSLQTCTRESNFGKNRGNDAKIVGGVTAEKNQWPFIARLTIGFDDGQESLCGGTIIDNNWVLTAAHCCDGASWINATFSDLRVTRAESKEFTFRASKIKKHPQYRASTFRNDVCLLQFADDIIASDPDGDVQMACLTDTLPKQGSGCWIAGWGMTSFDGATSNRLRQATVKIMDKNYCLLNSEYPASMIKREMICAGNLDNDGDGLTDGGVDSCQGDSGGPLICGIDGKAALVGVVSWGNGCASEGYPGVYSSAAYSSTYNWIRRTVNPKTTNAVFRALDWIFNLF